MRLRFRIRSAMMLVAITSVLLAVWLGNLLAFLVPAFLTSVMGPISDSAAHSTVSTTAL
jgi:hypothetical protein